MADRVISYEFRARFDSFRANLAATGKGVDDFGRKLTALDRQGAQMRQGLSTLGGAAGKIGLVAAAGVGAAVAAAANFEQAMSSVQAATHETAENMNLLRQAALDAGASTKYSATEAAGAIENLAKAGVSTRDILDGGLSGALNLAAAGNLDVAQAAEQAATAMTQFGLAGQDVPHIADLLAAGAGKAQGEVTDLGQALNQAGLVANQVGLSIEETTGGLAAFASAGLLGSDAGTSFKTMLSALTPNSKKAQDAMADLGISAYDAQGNFVGLANFAGNLQSALSGLTDEQRQTTLETIFGSDAVRAASVLYEQGASGIQEWTSAVNDQGYAAETAAIQMDNLKGDIEQLGGALETAFIGAGSGSQGPLRSLVQNLTDAVNVFNDLPPAAQSTATALLAVTAITGGAAWFGAKVITGVSETRQALADLGITSGRTGVSLENVAKLSGRLILVAGAVSALGEAVSKASGASLDATDLQRNLEAIAAGKGDQTISRLASDFNLLGSSVNQAAEPIQEAGRLFGILGDTGLDKASANIDAVDQALASMVESGNAEQAAAIFDRIMAAVTGMPEGTSFAPGIGEAGSRFDSYAVALDNASTAATGAASANDDLAASADGMSSAAYASAQAARDQADALEEARKAAHETAGQFFNLGDSLDDSKVSLSQWITDMQRSVADLRNFRLNAERAANNGLRQGLIAALQEAGPEGARRMAQLADATDSEIRRANRAWSAGQREINKYTDSVAGVPNSKSTSFSTPGLNESLSGARNLRSEIAKLDSKTITITTNYKRVNSVVDALPDRTRRAAGGPVWGRGSSTSDSIPAMLSNGEFVMRASAVQHYGLSTMHDINAMRLAEGGTTDAAENEKAKKARRRYGANFDVSWLNQTLRAFNRELDRAKKSLDAETKARDDAVAARDSVRSSVAAGLGQDLWATGSVWSGGGVNPTAKANAVAANAREFESLVTQLRNKGLDGSALMEAAASGDISRLRYLNSLPTASLNDYETSINSMEAALRAAGVATSSSLGLDALVEEQTAQAKALQQEVRDLTKEVKHQTKVLDAAEDRNSDNVTKGVNGGASRGAKSRRHQPKHGGVINK